MSLCDLRFSTTGRPTFRNSEDYHSFRSAISRIFPFLVGWQHFAQWVLFPLHRASVFQEGPLDPIFPPPLLERKHALLVILPSSSCSVHVFLS